MTTINRANEHNVRKQISNSLTDAEDRLTAVEADITALEASDGYALCVQCTPSNPTSSGTFYFGQGPKEMTVSALESRVYIPRTGVIVAAHLSSFAGIAATAGDVSLYIRVNNTSDTLIQTQGLASQTTIWSNTGLSINVTAGSYIEIKMTTPAWVTPPAEIAFGGHVFVR